ncbi:MAG: hypothetical protein KKD28_01810 [Chloroflexi bacterium]|nr:hypothetical protein [Chloroflexota bacterium]MBU1660191.1 hypothetical protein [Chloroflexota bacterium]
MKKPKKISEIAAPYKVEKERLNLYLPKSLVEELRARVPARERTQFIADVLERELRRIRLKAAIEASAGAWKDEDHPEMATGADIDRWIEEQRRIGTRDWSEEWNRND